MYIHTYILDYTCEEKGYLYFWVWLIFNNIIFLSFSFFCSFIHSFFFIVDITFVRLALRWGSKYRNEILIPCLHSCMLCFFYTTAMTQAQGRKMPREQTCPEWLSWKLSYQSIWQLQEEKEGLGWTFPRKDECKSLCQFLPSHPRSWSVLVHLDTTGMQRSPGGQQAVAGWWHSYLACIRLSDWNRKNNSRGDKALQVAGRKWV